MRPQSIVRFEIAYLLSVVVGLVNAAVNWNAGLAQVQAASPEAASWYPAMAAGTTTLSILISLLLWYFAARRASNVARWVITVFFAISILSLLYTFSTGAFPAGLAGILTIVGFLLNAAAVFMLFRPDANAWFTHEEPPVDPEATA